MDDDDIEVADSPMQRFVDAGDLEGLLTVVTPDDIAIAWHRYNATPEPKSYDHPDWWAIDLFWARELFDRFDLHRHLLLKLIEHGPEEALGAVAAGPLEDFVSDDEDDLQWIESECITNRRLRIALTGMWSASYVSEATMLRLDAAAGEPLSRPRPRSEWPPEMIGFEEAEQRLTDLVGDMSAYYRLEAPTDEQRAAAEEFKVALHALQDLRRR
jgi:hypothetical protein